jgi:hypothetical protein
VVWVQHSDDEFPRGTESRQIVPELVPSESEPLVEKNYGDSFEDTSLEDVLSKLGVGRLVVVGAETDACVRSTLHGAFVRGYDATLVSDAHTTGDKSQWGAPPPEQVISHTNLYWNFQSAGPHRRHGHDSGARLRRIAPHNRDCGQIAIQPLRTICPQSRHIYDPSRTPSTRRR